MSMSFVAIKTCDLCGKVDDYSFDHLYALAEVPAFFSALGWVRSEAMRTDACPDCVKSVTETRTEVKEVL